ncbi:MAG: ABC transporter ATP-binding protein [Alphaproteobacteria bacterium]
MTDATAEPLVSLRDIHLTLESAAGKVHILRGISLDVAPGEALAVAGPSGSGKSTMLMVLAGLERPSAGEITVLGHDLTRMGEDALARFRRRNVGIVFQSFHLVPTMTALENVAVPLEFAGRRDAFKTARAELEEVGLGHRLTHYPGQLSGGEQQRVAMARAVAAEPRLLLADEPTGNLDGRTGGRIMDLLFAMHRERGMTLILITHDTELAMRCGRIVHLRDGEIDSIEPVARAAAQ